MEVGHIGGTVQCLGELQKYHFGEILNSSPLVVSAVFKNPQFAPGFAHESKLLPGLIPPPTVLDAYGGMNSSPF